MWDKEIEHMTTRDIIEHLEQTRRDAAEDRDIEELSSAELDQISGARGGEPVGLEFRKRFNW